MAQSYTTDDGITLFEPGTVVSTKVIAGQGGTAAAGVVTLIGESDEGPHWSKEEELDQNEFGPDQIADVTRKYGSGRLVDAFRAIVAAANDPAIVGAVSSVKFIKTNDSDKATATIAKPGFANYASLAARREGAPGNLIKYRSETSQAEVAPSTGAFSYAPTGTGAVAFNLRNNGEDQKAISIPVYTDATSFAALIEDITKGITATGGDREDPLTGLNGIAITAAAPASDELTVTLAAASVYAPAPAVGDTAVIPLTGQYGAATDSAIAGTANSNVGSYIVTSVVNTATTATVSLKAMNITGPATSADAGTINAQEDDLIIFKPVTISNLTGQDRDVASGLTPDWASTTNDGTNVVLEITTSETWTAQPVAGDTFKLTATFAGITAGFYYVTASTSKAVTLVRLSNGSSGTTGTETALAAGFTVERPTIDGFGKTLEVDGDVSEIMKTSAGASVTFSDSIIYSSAEYINATTISRDTVEDTFESGGDIAISFGTTQASAKIVIDDEKITFWEGAGVVFTAAFDQYLTLQDVVDFVNSQPNYTAALGSNSFSVTNPSSLDRGEYFISSVGWRPGRIKVDATTWFNTVSDSGLAEPTITTQSGLPEEITPDQFLSGGARNGTSSLQVTQAIDAADNVETNFSISLYAKDAIDDIAEGETASSSTYTIDAINALMRNHAIKNSRLKAKKNRISFVAKEASYADQKEAAGDVGSFRVAFGFMNVKLPDSQGRIRSYQPWMSSVIAAGMQAAAGYKGIVKKFANINGAFHKAGDYNPKSQTNRENALKAGLMPLEPVRTGGFRWVSDQMSYTVDNNFVFNSLQAVYIADLMSLTLIDRFDRAIVGKSVAEISAAGALSFLESELFNFRRLKWITSSDDATKGWKNASVRLQGGVLRVSVEVKLAGLIYFVPINLAISEVSQTASS